MRNQRRIHLSRPTRGKGFTLIELLVVIAIIAILAAILFPVFAQAKLAAKKTAGLAQAKQTGTAMLLYTGDSDDTAPLGTTPDLSTGVERYKPTVFTNQNPDGWFNYAFQAEHALMWNNTIQPYAKNYDIYNLPGTVTADPWGTTATAEVKAPKGSNLTYNGVLGGWSMTAIERVSTLPMVWQGQGNLTRKGAAMANPRLNCTGTGPCRYNPGGAPQADMAVGARGDIFNIFLNGQANYYVYGQTALFVSTDSSARAVQVGDGNRAPSPASANRVWPIQFIEPNGTCTRNFIRGRYAGASLYTAAFMPDNSFQN